MAPGRDNVTRSGRHRWGFAVTAALALAWPPAAKPDDAYEAARRGMVRVIEAHAFSAREALAEGRLEAPVLAAMRRVPRHEFVPAHLAAIAYQDRPLPIGHGQTISQPFIVALMTDLAGVGAGDKMLEIGTGSAYQAAVAAEIGAEVHSIEIVGPLAESARRRLDRLGYRRVQTRHGDGYYGWSEAAPFDAILVTAAASHVPPPLVQQLKPGGRMVIPVGGGGYSFQHLVLVEKDDDGRVTSRQLLPVRFVPLTGGH